MRQGSQPGMGKTQKLLVGVGLLVAAVVTFALTSGFVLQAFKGPRTVTEQELAELTAVPGWGQNYVTYTPAKPAVDTGLQWGKKNNPGTKFLLLPVGNRAMLCSARISDNGPAYVGRLELADGSVEQEVIGRLNGQLPGLKDKISPVMLQTVRSIWFDTSVALVAIVGMGIGGLVLLVGGLRAPTPAPLPAEDY